MGIQDQTINNGELPARVNRDSNGRLLAGSNLNPHGNPKIGDAMTRWMNVYGQKNREELQAVLDDPQASSNQKTVAARLLDSNERGKLGLFTFQELMDRSLGKPGQSIDLTVSGQVDVSAASLGALAAGQAELLARGAAIIARLEAILGGAHRALPAPAGLPPAGLPPPVFPPLIDAPGAGGEIVDVEAETKDDKKQE